MHEISDDIMMALADGEIKGRARADLKAQLRTDPDLQKRFAVFADSRDLLARALDAGPVPKALQGNIPAPALAAASLPSRQASAVGGHITPQRRKPLSRWALLVAVVALGAISGALGVLFGLLG